MVEYDKDTGKPIQDGSYVVILNNQTSSPYPFKDWTISLESFGVLIQDKAGTINQVIPWHRIENLFQNANSKEYLQAVDEFRMRCDHNYQHDDNHGPFDYCVESCTKCGLIEPSKEEHIHNN